MGRQAGIPLVLFLIISQCNLAFSDDCGRDVAYYLAQISSFPSQTDSSGLIPLLQCLEQPTQKYADSFETFASDEVILTIERETKKNRLEVYKVLSPLLNSKYDVIKGHAAAVLAFYHYHPASERLAYFSNERVKTVLFSILEYRAGLEWAINYYNRVATDSSIANPDSIYADKMSALNLLYHLIKPRSIPFLNHVIGNDPDGRVRDRAKLVKERIISRFPELG